MSTTYNAICPKCDVRYFCKEGSSVNLWVDILTCKGCLKVTKDREEARKLRKESQNAKRHTTKYRQEFTTINIGGDILSKAIHSASRRIHRKKELKVI